MLFQLLSSPSTERQLNPLCLGRFLLACPILLLLPHCAHLLLLLLLALRATN